jgi:Deoxyhypusine synthase
MRMCQHARSADPEGDEPCACLSLQCLAPTYLGDFALRGLELRQRGLNRVGNMLVPNNNYCAFEDWIMPILDAMLTEQEEEGTRWTPSKARALCAPTKGGQSCRPLGCVVGLRSGVLFVVSGDLLQQGCQQP